MSSSRSTNTCRGTSGKLGLLGEGHVTFVYGVATAKYSASVNRLPSTFNKLNHIPDKKEGTKKMCQWKDDEGVGV